MNYIIPLSYTTRVNPDFTNFYPSEMLEASSTITMDLGEEDWVIFNIQGQGKYTLLFIIMIKPNYVYFVMYVGAATSVFILIAHYLYKLPSVSHCFTRVMMIVYLE